RPMIQMPFLHFTVTIHCPYSIPCKDGVSFSHSLYQGTEIKSLIAGVQIQPKGIARNFVSNCCTIFSIYRTVAVYIFIDDIARAVISKTLSGIFVYLILVPKQSQCIISK